LQAPWPGPVRSFALFWLTNACSLLYLVTGVVFVPSAQIIAIESLIYGPFAALALIDLWCHRRPAKLSGDVMPVSIGE
jgi:hypothetical protein